MMSGRWLRIAPLDSSTPLQTMSYWYALIVRGSRVSSASRPPCGFRRGDRADHRARLERLRERAESRAAEHVADVVDDERIPQVGLVGAVARERVVVRDARKRRRRHRAAVGELLEHAVEHGRDGGEHV